MTASSSPGRTGILSLTIKDKQALLAAYMPFVLNGGLFVPTTRQYALGEEVYLLLSLMDEPERIPVSGRVVWSTPPGAEGNRTAGIGVQFSGQEGERARSRIETWLAGALDQDRKTHTL